MFMKATWGALSVALVLTACGSATTFSEQRAMSVEGERGTVVASKLVPSGEVLPPGVELAGAHMEVDRDGLRARLVPLHDVWESISGKELRHFPVWSFSLWSKDGHEHEDEAIPAYWIALTVEAEGSTLPAPSPPPIKLMVWLCHREVYAAALEATRGFGSEPREPGSEPLPSCHLRSPGAQARFTGERVELEIPGGELAELGERFWWTAVATGTGPTVLPIWTHCVPACPDTGWEFPPSGSRASF